MVNFGCSKQYTELEKIVQFCCSTDDVIFTAANQNLGAHLTQISCFDVLQTHLCPIKIILAS